jgi:allantoate deiminase
MTWAPGLLARCDELAALSETSDGLTRTYLTPEHARANALVLQWMRDAGMAARVDAVGNVVGRYEGTTAGAPALMLGSHLDTVRNAGKYDGMLGVVAAIACVERLHRQGRRLGFPIEVIGFANEEGTRFGATLTGSRALTGTIEPGQIDARDAAGVSMREAMRGFGLDPERAGAAARRPHEVAAYIELHIEQGPVLEAHGLALGVVTAIAGATRLRAELKGLAGHAGTVPMGGRQDALAGAAEAIAEVERRCRGVPGLVGTVGWVEAQPGAVNVIPGLARFTLDVRAEADETRRAALADILETLEAIASRRRLALTVTPLHENPSTPCSPWLMAALEAAINAEGLATMRLPSGAGHDAMALRALTEIGMMFVRCTAGVSHNPAEAVLPEDVELAARALYRFVVDFAPQAPGG